MKVNQAFLLCTTLLSTRQIPQSSLRLYVYSGGVIICKIFTYVTFDFDVSGFFMATYVIIAVLVVLVPHVPRSASQV
jgi:hypothetical protein